MKYAFFYLREGSYLDQLPKDFPDLCKVYTNEGLNTVEEQQQANQELERWTTKEIPLLCEERKRPLHHYTAHWDSRATSPELLLPLVSPSMTSANLKQWCEKWSNAGIEIKDNETSINDPALIAKAQDYNQRRSMGRLTRFEIEGEELRQTIIKDLKDAITERYPDHIEAGGANDLQKELDQQEQYLYTGSEGFISRGDDFRDLDAYVEGEEKKLFVLTAPGGMGKSTLLAKWIEEYRNQIADRPNQSIHFQFIGQSDRSTMVHSLLYFLMCELKELIGKVSTDIPDDPQKLRQELLKLLETAGNKGKTIIVMDALNQLESGLSDLSWLPYQLPPNVKLLVSFKTGEPAADELLKQMQGKVIHSEVKPFESMEDRQKLVQVYLSQFLKNLDEHHLETLITSDGAKNPLFLKVVLSELRVFGAFANLGEKIRLDFGKTPVSAFEGVLKRLENDPAYSPIEPNQAVPFLFGLLAHARQGLSLEELTGLFVREFNKPPQDAQDTINLYLRQVRSFLAHRDGRYDFFFESVKLASQELYVGEGFPKRLAQDWHRLLAEYFTARPLQLEDAKGNIPNRRKLSEQPYQQASGGMGDELIKTLTDYWFMESKIGALGVSQLIEDYGFAFNSAQALFKSEEKLDGMKLIHGTLLLASHLLAQDKHLLASQLIGRLLWSENPQIQSLLAQASNKNDVSWLRPMTSSLKTPGSAEEFTLEGSGDIVITPDEKKLISCDNELCIWDLNSRIKENTFLIQRQQEHLPIFITPDGNHLIYVKQDHSICTWNLVTNCEDRILGNHWFWYFNERASHQFRIVDSQKSRGVSLSDDGNLTVWNLHTGQSGSTIRPNKNVTTIKMTMDGSQVIALSEDGTIQVYELPSLSLINSFASHLDMDKVEAIAISPDGRSILACANQYFVRTLEPENRRGNHFTEYS